ncbi:MAG TPA: NAD(P)/FAD-dependent oxidoreductase [Bacteroidia bacterium]|nr:NAD(P)/FAD-dependent oxidoreductase [Bacteroidia bacterium]HNU33541.1 NAD(P)/FAD-dependent oxidoreductase [Bacteroidia bacterium]
MINSELIKPKVIIIGAGFGGLALINKLKNKPVDVTVFDKNNYHLFQPLLYQVATGGLSPDAIAYPVRKITGKTNNVSFRMAEVKEIVAEENKVRTAEGNYYYDHLVIATGAQTNFFGNEQLEKHCMQLKSINTALDIRSDILEEFEKGVTHNSDEELKHILNFVVVGGGPTGVELAGALAEMKRNVIKADYGKDLDKEKMMVHLIESGSEVLGTFSDSLSKKAMEALGELGVKVWLNTRVETYDGKTLQLNNGNNILTDTVIWAAGVKGKIINGIDATCIGKGGRIKINDYMQVSGYKNIYAVGDVAIMSGDKKYPDGHPMVAPVAQQQAALLAKNILAQLSNKPAKGFSYFDKGSMATIGRHRAILEAFGIRLSGILAWLGWMALHLMILVSFRSKLIVFTNWLWNYITYQRHIRLIIRPSKKQGD